MLCDQSWTNLFIASYCLGPVATSGLMAGVHDISHNIAFGNGRPRLFGILANLPTAFPSSIAFKKYHILHHRYK